MNVWKSLKATTQPLPIILLDAVGQGLQKNFPRGHDGKTTIRMYRQAVASRWIGSDDFAAYRRMMEKASTTDLLRWAREFRRKKSLLLRFVKTAIGHDLQKLSRKKLADLMRTFGKLSAEAYQHGYDYTLLNAFYDERLNGVIMRSIGKREDFQHVLSFLSGQEKPTDIHKEQRALGKLAILNHSRVPKTRLIRSIEHHCQRFGYLNVFEYHGEPSTVQDIRSRLAKFRGKNEREISQMINADFRRMEKNKKLTNSFFRNHHVRKADRAIVKVLKEHVYTSMWVDEQYHKVSLVIRPLLLVVARRIGMSYAAVIAMTTREHVHALTHGLTALQKRTIRQRLRGFVYERVDGRTRILIGAEKRAYEKAIKQEERSFSTVTELKGQIGNPGKVVGRVQVIRALGDIAKFQRNRILVAASTAPTHVPAMERAAAFVTDEGGLLSHAAIVSREFHKPCVIGTKIATKVLKDGDMVEVDAERGIVRKIP